MCVWFWCVFGYLLKRIGFDTLGMVEVEVFHYPKGIGSVSVGPIFIYMLLSLRLLSIEI